MKHKYIEIIEYRTLEVVRRTDVTGWSDERISRRQDTLEINMNLDDYYTDIKETDEPINVFP